MATTSTTKTTATSRASAALATTMRVVMLLFNTDLPVRRPDRQEGADQGEGGQSPSPPMIVRPGWPGKRGLCHQKGRPTVTQMVRSGDPAGRVRPHATDAPPPLPGSSGGNRRRRRARRRSNTSIRKSLSAVQRRPRASGSARPRRGFVSSAPTRHQRTAGRGSRSGTGTGRVGVEARRGAGVEREAAPAVTATSGWHSGDANSSVWRPPDAEADAADLPVRRLEIAQERGRAVQVPDRALVGHGEHRLHELRDLPPARPLRACTGPAQRAEADVGEPACDVPDVIVEAHRLVQDQQPGRGSEPLGSAR